MTLEGGGWTLVAVSSDDGQHTWTWNNRHYWDIDTITFGVLGALSRDFKSPANHNLAFDDLLFVHAPSDMWASYHNVGDGSGDQAEAEVNPTISATARRSLSCRSLGRDTMSDNRVSAARFRNAPRKCAA